MAATAPSTRIALVALEPDQAGRDFTIQGEYVGELIRPNEPPRKIGAQVVASGHSTFVGALLMGGLPGTGWDGSPRIELAGRARDGAVSLAGMRVRGYTAVLKDGLLEGAGPDGAKFRLVRTARQSPTLNQKPPDGAIVLFDGTGLDHWSKGVKDERGFLAAVSPGDPPVAPGPTTRREWRDFTLHLEFRVPFKPLGRGEQRGNSGVQLQGRYEIQILDSFGRAEAWNDCGGFYGILSPKVNACLPPLTWQTLDIEFRAPRFEAGRKVHDARATVRLNGILIHEDVALKAPTVDGVDEVERGPLILQSHGDPVFYRNVWIVEK